MNALSLSHLTYCDRTTTVRSFHSLDHPPFPCTNNLSPRHMRVKRARRDCVKDEHRRSPYGIAAGQYMATLSLAFTRTQSIFVETADRKSSGPCLHAPTALPTPPFF